MVLLGGLEFVVGGYLIHRYHKDKNEKKRLQEEAQQRRHHTFPGPAPQSYGLYPQQPTQQAGLPPQKYACYASQAQYPPQPQPQFQPHHHHRPHTPQPVPHRQTFNIPRRPLPHQQPPQIIQPLHRTDSFATISRMPIANGSRPHTAQEEQAPSLPARPQVSSLTIPQQQPANYPYSNAGFSVSTPGLGSAPASYPTGYIGQHGGGRQTVDDNWETYAPQTGHGHYAPSESTALGEDDPPPPYRP